MVDLPEERVGVRLDFDLEDSTFVIGPTEARPFDTWLPQAVELTKTVLGVRRSDRKAERYIIDILARVGQPDIFPYSVFRWVDLGELPFRASFSMVAREEADAEDFLSAVDSVPVEPPTVEELPAPPGHTVRRSISYSDIGGGILAEVRYAVDTGHPEAVVWIQGGTRTPGELADALDDLDAFAASMRVTSIR